MARLPSLLLACSMFATNALAQASSITIEVSTSNGDEPQELLLSGTTTDQVLSSEFENGTASVEVSPGSYRTQPRTIILRWQDGEVEDFPIFLLPEFGGQRVHILFVGKSFGPESQSAADELCRDRRPVDIVSAFEMVFGCREWTEQLEQRRRDFSKEHLRAVNGWLIGNNYLFRSLPEEASIDISPFGFQDALIERIKRILTLIDRDGRAPHLLAPLNVEELRRILHEHEQQVLRFDRSVKRLIEAGDFKAAGELNEFLIESFATAVAAKDAPSVYRIDADLLRGNGAEIARYQSLSEP